MIKIFLLIFFILLVLIVCFNFKIQKVVEFIFHFICGVWLINVDSDVFFFKVGLEVVVEYCVCLGFNIIYIVIWNWGYIFYFSVVMEKIFGVCIDFKFEGCDLLQEFIDFVYVKNICVVVWFEFGFVSFYKEVDGGYLFW